MIRATAPDLELSPTHQFGVDLIRRAIEEPLRMIVSNGGEPAVVVDNIKKQMVLVV